MLGKPVPAKMDEFPQKVQTASFLNSLLQIFPKFPHQFFFGYNTQNLQSLYPIWFSKCASHISMTAKIWSIHLWDQALRFLRKVLYTSTHPETIQSNTTYSLHCYTLLRRVIGIGIKYW